MRDPLLRPGAANVGGAGLARIAPTGARWQLGEVVEYNSATHTSTVRTHAGQPLRDVPQIKPTGGGYDHLETGTTVVISWDLGIPAIIGCMDFVGPRQAAIVPPTLTGTEGYGNDDPTQPTAGGNSYKSPLAPVDMSPGDWAQVGTLGNHVAVMGGGLTLLGSLSAQLRSFGMSGVLQHIARRVESITDFGTWRVENDQGRTSFVLRAGSTQATETGMDEQNWTIRIDLGATGDVFDFVITEPKGRVLFRMHVGSDGRVQLYGDGGVDVSSGSGGPGEARQDVAGTRRAAVEGDDIEVVHGVKTLEVDGDMQCQAGGSIVSVVGKDRVVVVGGNRAETVAGDQVSVITGDMSGRVGKAIEIDIGDKASVGIGKNMDVSIGGDADVKAKGRVKINGSKVLLGPSGSHPLPRFDLYLRDHAEFLTHLVSAIGSLVPSNPIALATQLTLMQKFIVMASQGFPYESTKVSND